MAIIHLVNFGLRTVGTDSLEIFFSVPLSILKYTQFCIREYFSFYDIQQK